jgi:DNA-binding LytR/AlgR family response regulator
MNCIIIDDDCFVRKITEDFVQKTDQLVLLHSLSGALEATQVLNSFDNVDLIFLDIEMPDMTGIEFLNSFNILPQIIIISSREKYAVNAFEYDVTDYLLKPFSYSRFCKAVDKALERKKDMTKEIFVKHNNSLVKIKYADILWIEAMENYITINTLNEKLTILSTMLAIEKILPPKQFLRTHRSFIVNIDAVHSIEDNSIKIAANDIVISSIPVSKQVKSTFLKKLNLIAR